MLPIQMKNGADQKESEGSVMLERDMTLEECCVYVKHRLELGKCESVWRYAEEMYTVLLFLPGSGKSRRLQLLSRRGQMCL